MTVIDPLISMYLQDQPDRLCLIGLSRGGADAVLGTIKFPCIVRITGYDLLLNMLGCHTRV